MDRDKPYILLPLHVNIFLIACQDAHELRKSIYRMIHLPIEIVQEIFQCCLPRERHPPPSPKSAPLLLTQICNHWKYVARANPHLWSALRISLHSRDVPDGHVEVLSSWLKRSRTLPLSLKITAGKTVEAHPYLDVLAEHSFHWDDISVELPESLFSELSSKSLSLNALQRLDISTTDASYTPSFNTVVKSFLRSPKLHNVAVRMNFLRVALPWSQLQEIEISGYLEPQQILTLLRNSTHLSSLSTGVGLNPIVTESVTHTLLRKIKLRTALPIACQRLLPYLVTPALEELCMIIEQKNYTPISFLQSFFIRSCCSLKALTLQGPFGLGGGSDLIAVLVSCSSLRTLCLRSLMPDAIFEVLRDKTVCPRLRKLDLRLLGRQQVIAVLDLLRGRCQSITDQSESETLQEVNIRIAPHVNERDLEPLFAKYRENNLITIVSL